MDKYNKMIEELSEYLRETRPGQGSCISDALKKLGIDNNLPEWTPQNKLIEFCKNNELNILNRNISIDADEPCIIIISTGPNISHAIYLSRADMCDRYNNICAVIVKGNKSAVREAE